MVFIVRTISGMEIGKASEALNKNKRGEKPFSFTPRLMYNN